MLSSECWQVVICSPPQLRTAVHPSPESSQAVLSTYFLPHGLTQLPVFLPLECHLNGITLCVRSSLDSSIKSHYYSLFYHN